MRAYTDARIALGRAGVSQPTVAQLAFQSAHAQAREAVGLPLDVVQMSKALKPLDWPLIALHSAAPDRARYLQRPDWGRRLDEASCERLRALRPHKVNGEDAFDLAFVIADGLSALAVHRHALPLLSTLRQSLREDPAQRWRLAPLTVVEQGRVAVGDEVGEILAARCVVVLIGERPGLSSPDSLGVYFTWNPRVGRSDAERNCLSNVRDAGLSPAKAASRLKALLCEARKRQISGIALKDETGAGLESDRLGGS